MNAREDHLYMMTVTELQFADDAAVVSATRDSIVRAANVLDEVTSQWGLSMSKTKLLVVGEPRVEEDLQPINIRGESIEAVTDFRYLGSMVEANGELMMDVEDRIGRVSRAFGSLCRPVFRNGNLSLKMKRMVYRSAVLGVLLYGTKTWATKRTVSQKVESFNNKCLRRILNITRAQQRAEHTTSVQVRKIFGMEEALEDVITARRLRWLGHLARMEDIRLPKRLLFGWLPQCRPAHGTKLRRRDRVRKDLKRFHIDERIWYRIAKERGHWRAECREGLSKCTEESLEKDRMKREAAAVSTSESTSTSALILCDTCRRSFRRRQDIARHKCQ